MEGPIVHFPIYKENFSYMKADGGSTILELPLFEVPAGTLLFRGVQLPNPKLDEDPRLFVRDWLGYPRGDRFCMTPTHNTFFYTSPYVPFGAHTVGEWFNAVLICITVKPVKVVAMISPSQWTRGGKEIKALDGTAPIQRCDKFDYTCIPSSTSLEAKKEKELKAWDNCIRPEFAMTNTVSGWLAIADYDSLDNFKEGLHGKDTTMGAYIMELDKRLPGKGVELLTSTYTDASRHRGFPEIVLHPWSPHPGTENQYTEAKTEEDAADAIAEISDRFTYLPMACITERGIVEAFTGDFKASDLPAYSRSSTAGPMTRAAIDALEAEYLNKLMKDGVEIPGKGRGYARFDSRTGFYVLDILTGNYYSKKDKSSVSYNDLLFPLVTPADRETVLEYKIKYRTFDSTKLATPDTLLNGKEVLRNFVFERPDELYKQFKELEIRLPSRLIPYIWSATETFQKNLANRKNKNDPRGAEEARRRAEEAKEKIKESLEIIAKKKVELQAAAKAQKAKTKSAQRGKPATRGRSKSKVGGRFSKTRKNKEKNNLVLAEYRPTEISEDMQKYIGSTMNKFWSNI